MSNPTPFARFVTADLVNEAITKAGDDDFVLASLEPMGADRWLLFFVPGASTGQTAYFFEFDQEDDLNAALDDEFERGRVITTIEAHDQSLLVIFRDKPLASDNPMDALLAQLQQLDGGDEDDEFGS